MLHDGQNLATFPEREYTAIANPQAPFTAGQTSPRLQNYAWKGAAILLDVESVGSPAGTITEIDVQAECPGLSGDYFTIYKWTGLTVNAAGQYGFLVYPGASAAGQWTASPIQGVIPENFRIVTVHADSSQITYSVTVSYIPS